MSWNKIEEHLFEKYCVEGEDKELCRLMEEHDKEIRDKAIEEFCKRLVEQSERFSTIPFTWVSTKNIRKIAEQMKEQKEEYKFDRESDYELE